MGGRYRSYAATDGRQKITNVNYEQTGQTNVLAVAKREWPSSKSAAFARIGISHPILFWRVRRDITRFASPPLNWCIILLLLLFLFGEVTVISSCHSGRRQSQASTRVSEYIFENVTSVFIRFAEIPASVLYNIMFIITC